MVTGVVRFEFMISAVMQVHACTDPVNWYRVHVYIRRVRKKGSTVFGISLTIM